VGLGQTRAEIEAAKATLRAMLPQSLAELMCSAMEMQTSYPRDPYHLADESWGFTWGNDNTERLDDTDCSGNIYGNARVTDQIGQQLGLGRVLWRDGGTFRRLTAAGYESVGVKVVDGSYRTFDVPVFANATRTYHIAAVTRRVSGIWHTIEARQGLEEHTLGELMARPGFAGVYRFAWLDLGQEEPDPLPDTPGGRVLHVGMTGTDVLDARDHLSAHLGTGYIDLSDIFTPWMAECVRIFQWLRGLTIDGEVGVATWAELVKAPAFPYLAPTAKTRYAGLAVRHLKRHGYAKLFSDWTDTYGYWLGQEVKKWRASEGLPAGTHLGPEGSWPALLS
jgi:hypothetical protein